MRARLTLAAGTALLALGGSVFAAAPALALGCDTTPTTGTCSGQTTVTFVAGVGSGAGVLSLAGGAGVAPLLPAGGTNFNSLTGALPPAVVTDTRVPAVNQQGHWSIQVASQGFTLNNVTTPSSATTIAPGKATVSVAGITDAATLVTAGLGTSQTAPGMLNIPGTATMTNYTDATHSGPKALTAAGVTVLDAATNNANVYPYVATLTVDASGAPIGAYTGTVTQSVS